MKVNSSDQNTALRRVVILLHYETYLSSSALLYVITSRFINSVITVSELDELILFIIKSVSRVINRHRTIFYIFYISHSK